MQAVAETAGIRNKAGNCCAERNTGLLNRASGAGADHRAWAWGYRITPAARVEAVVSLSKGCQRSRLAHRFRSRLGQPLR
jgi:hypothetical protein